MLLVDVQSSGSIIPVLIFARREKHERNDPTLDYILESSNDVPTTLEPFTQICSQIMPLHSGIFVLVCLIRVTPHFSVEGSLIGYSLPLIAYLSQLTKKRAHLPVICKSCAFPLVWTIALPNRLVVPALPSSRHELASPRCCRQSPLLPSLTGMKFAFEFATNPTIHAAVNAAINT